MIPKPGPVAEAGLLLHALDACTDGVELDDVDGAVLFVSRSWCTLLGRDRQEVTGNRCDSLGLDRGTGPGFGQGNGRLRQLEAAGVVGPMYRGCASGRGVPLHARGWQYPCHPAHAAAP